MAKEELPADILFSNILPRLPPKSQSRFKCVSKQWHSFLTSPSFRKIHRRHVINNDRQYNQKLLFLPNNKPWEFHTIDCESPENGLTASRPVPFKLKRFQEMSIVSSLHGMVCVAISYKSGHNYNQFEYSDLILWNPSTGDYKTLSKPGSSHNDCYKKFGNRFGLYYSSCNDDYRLVCVYVTEHPNVYIYSLKSDLWRKVESTRWSSSRVFYHLVTSVLFNEKLYFLHAKHVSSTSYSLTTFDTQTEKLSDIATPHFGNPTTYCMGFMVVRDCIHFYGANKDSEGQHYTMEVWRMDGDGDWTMVETCSLKKHLFSYTKPGHLMRNGNWLKYSGSEEGIYVLDTKKQTKKIMCSIHIAFHPALKYIETIVSPNQYISSQ